MSKKIKDIEKNKIEILELENSNKNLLNELRSRMKGMKESSVSLKRDQ